MYRIVENAKQRRCFLESTWIPLDVAGFYSAVNRRGTLLGGQFEGAGRLQKGNGGAQRFVQHGRIIVHECKRINEPNSRRRVEQ